jgi:hypothetical protein
MSAPAFDRAGAEFMCRAETYKAEGVPAALIEGTVRSLVNHLRAALAEVDALTLQRDAAVSMRNEADEMSNRVHDALTQRAERAEAERDEMAHLMARPSWTCVGCGSQGEFRTVTYNTPGEPVDYDMECVKCGCSEIEETADGAFQRREDEAEKELAALRGELADARAQLAKADDAQSNLASLADRMNTWARENGCEEIRDWRDLREMQQALDRMIYQ